MFMLTVNCWNYEPFTLSLWFWIPKWLNKLTFVKLSTLFCIQTRSSIFNESSYYNCFMIYYTLFCGMYRNHFVRLSIRLYLLIKLWRSIGILTSYKDCLWPEAVLWFWPKIIWANSRSLKGKVQNSCQIHLFENIENIGNIGSSYFTKRLLFTRGCFMVMPQVIWAS